jgi:hypothetical protein
VNVTGEFCAGERRNPQILTCLVKVIGGVPEPGSNVTCAVTR